MSEAETDVRIEDQNNINTFGTLNNRLLEIRSEISQGKSDLEKLEDATTEMMMASGGKIMLLIGESFVEVDEEFSSQYCERKVQELESKIESLKTEEQSILSKQEVLKKVLYGRFGDSINLES